MAKYWKEPKPRHQWLNELTPGYIYCVEVCGFTFDFAGIDQMIEVRDWFSQKTHKSTRLPDSKWLRSEHDVAQRWHERLPAEIKKGSKRTRIVKALDEAIDVFSEQQVCK